MTAGGPIPLQIPSGAVEVIGAARRPSARGLSAPFEPPRVTVPAKPVARQQLSVEVFRCPSNHPPSIRRYTGHPHHALAHSKPTVPSCTPIFTRRAVSAQQVSHPAFSPVQPLPGHDGRLAQHAGGGRRGETSLGNGRQRGDLGLDAADPVRGDGGCQRSLPARTVPR